MKKPLVMSAFSGRLPFIIYLTLLSLIAVPCIAQRQILRSYDGTVVIDPGHGGHDIGAKGADALNEKEITLTLSRLISATLQSDYRVVLTRNGDYWLDMPGRTAIANQEKADLFVSIHIGGSFDLRSGGITVYYFKETEQYRTDLESTEPQPDDQSSLQKWDFVQMRHQSESMNLATKVQAAFQNMDTINANPIEGLPLTVLRGADMPAVTVEVGNISHPLEGRLLADELFLAEVAERLGKAIDAYIKKD